jgi:intein/homing endonuclease
MKKLKVLVVPSDRTGVSYYRSTNPHLALENNYPNEFHVDVDYEPDLNDDTFLKQYDIIHYHRTLGQYEQMESLVAKFKSLGIISIMDLDDHWSPGPHHPAYHLIKQAKLDEKILGNIKVAENVTTTTDLFAEEIAKYNKNVYVLPNAIDPTEKQFTPNLEPSNGRVRIGWLGGSSHLVDLQILKGIVGKLKTDNLLDKVQFVLCGFDLRGTHTEINQQTGEQKVRAIKPTESVWYQYERIFTDDYKSVSPEYRDFLLKFRQEEFPNVSNEPYRRVWTKPISTYASNYNLFDISLAPIEENVFNKAKCIVGDSLISTNNGFKHISDIVESELRLKTELNGVENDVVNYFKYENVETIKITTKNGFELEGTPHHRIFIDNKWVELKDLAIGDYIELTKPSFLQTEYQEITYPMLLTKNITQEKIDNSSEDMLPRIRINENWGRLLGYLLGDGHYNGKSGISISCDKRHTDVVDDVVNLYKSIGLNPLTYEKKLDKRCNNSLAKEGFGVDIKSTCINFLSIAKKYGWCGSHGKTFRVPKVILESPKSVIKEFLKGLFEADGTVSENSCVSLTSKDLKLIQQVQILLLGLGINGKITHTYNKTYRKYYYNLVLGRLNSEIFSEEIGFVSEHKKNRLEKLVTGKHSNNEHKIIFNDEIIKVESSINTVYDIEVDDVHEYNANGIKNHNSQLKVIEAGFHKKAIIAQDFGPYKIDVKNAIQYGGGFDLTANGILIDSKKNHKDWYSAIKKLILNPEVVTTLQNNLFDSVKDVYSMNKVTENRRELYLKLVNDKQVKDSEKLLDTTNA